MALALGYASPARMLAEMRPSELGEWAALWSISPWGQQRDDLRAGVIASTVANVHRDPKRRPTPFRPLDFMPFDERDDRERNRDLSRRLLAALGLTPKEK